MIKLHKISSRLRLAILASVLPLLGLTAQAQNSVTEGLVAYWSFDGNFEDSVGIFNGTANGADPIVFTPGKPGFGQSMVLDGVDQFVEVTGGEPIDLAFEGGTMSVAGWFKVGAFDKSWQALIAKGEQSSWRVHRRRSEQGFAHAGGTGEGPAGRDVNDGEWHHFVAISDAEAANFGTALYIDGTIDTQEASTPSLAANGQRVKIGENPDTGNRTWNGEIDDIAIWDRVLQENEISTLYNNGAGRSIKSFFGTSIEVVGVGTDALLGGDLTDPEDDGNEAAGDGDSSWNWVSITSNNEPGFGGGEFSYNIFDNTLGGGNDKWCCDDPSAANPLHITVEFINPVAITHFTISSANDIPDRDPIRFKILGSNDGTSFTPIYERDSDESLWTERLQVVKITLVEASPLYKFIRYEVTDTAGPLHQVGEIEYYGNFGGASIPAVSGTAKSPESFLVRVMDGDDAKLVSASVQLTVDGQAAATTLSQDGDVTTITHTPTVRFASGSDHTWVLTVEDDAGNTIENTGKFTTIDYATLTAASKVTPDTSKPGFRWRVHQNPEFNQNNNDRPEEQLAGLLGENLADAFSQGVAIALGVPLDFVLGVTDPVTFEIDTVINMSQFEGDLNGEFTPDDQMPGIPGIDAGTDGIAGEIMTYIEMPLGKITFVVNSDDGFRTTMGLSNDVFLDQVAGEFSGSRGANDTVFVVFVDEAGVYPVRTVWEEGGGGANIEFKAENADGIRVLVNDVANGGLKAYRAITSSPAAVTSVTPEPGATDWSPGAAIQVIIEEGSDPVGTASVKLTLNGVEVPVNVDKSGSTVSITHNPAAGFTPDSSHTVNLVFSAGTSRSQTWSLGIPKPSGAAAEFTSITLSADGSITIEWTGGGTFESAPEVTGPWTDVTGATSPFTFTPTAATLFGRIRN